jgi:bifunctional enzyme CysN/CysC
LTREVTWHAGAVRRRGGATVWFTGLSGSGKSTLAAAVEAQLAEDGTPAYFLDGDNLRFGLNADLGFAPEDRDENVRRTGEVARLFADAGLIALVSLVSPYREARDKVRAAHADANLPFLEVHVDTPLEVCEQRDPKGLYARARSGEIRDLTGVDAPYEAPEAPALTWNGAEPVAAGVGLVLAALAGAGGPR